MSKPKSLAKHDNGMKIAKVDAKQGSNGVQLPLMSPKYYKSAKSKRDIVTLRCPEGYVFDGSHHLLGTVEDRGVLRYNDTSNQWLKLDGTEIDTPDGGFKGLSCKRKYCEPLGIVDSDKEYDVVVDNDENMPSNIQCNQGYVFETTNHRGGKIQCGVVPEMTNDLSKESEVAWLAYNPNLDTLCSQKTQTQCEQDEIEYIISDDINQDYVSSSSGEKLKCTWVPSVSKDAQGNESGLSRDGYCKFIHRADFNKTEPICKSMYCSKKEVIYSDRVDGGIGALPGPEEGSVHGDCINFDGQIIDQITNSSDCACFKHKACDTCVSDENCQWCGYSKDDATKGAGGFCYSTKTHLSICNESISRNVGGLCNHAKTNLPRPSEPSGGWSTDTCESQVCVTNSYWKGLNTQTRIQDEGNSNYHTDKKTREECLLQNNFWDENAIHATPDFCILTNNKLKGVAKGDLEFNYNPLSIPNNIGESKYYKIKRGGETIAANKNPSDGVGGSEMIKNCKNNPCPIKLSISDKVCVPKSDSPAYKGNKNTADGQRYISNFCTSLKNKSDCESAFVDSNRADNTNPGDLCSWIDNPIRDSLFNWQKGINTITFATSGDASKNCPIIYEGTTLGNKLNKESLSLSFKVVQGGTQDEIELTRLDKDMPNPKYNTDNKFYMANGLNFPNCPITNVETEMFTQTTCESDFAAAGSTKPTTSKVPHSCVGGTRYCTDKTIDKYTGEKLEKVVGVSNKGGPPGAPQGSWKYYQTSAEAVAAGEDPKYPCVGDRVDYECFPPELNIGKYNCSKTINANDNTQCEGTSYSVQNSVKGDKGNVKTINAYSLGGKRFKNYIKCDTHGSEVPVRKTRCEYIGDDYAHWGGVCSSGKGGDSLPKKQICELVSEYLDGGGSLTYPPTGGSGNPIDYKDKGVTWGKLFNKSNRLFEWGCYKDDGNLYRGDEICNMATAAAAANILTGPSTTSTTTFSTRGTDSCIIDGVPNKTGYTSSVTNVQPAELKDMCTSGSDHYVAFDFVNNVAAPLQKGTCKIQYGPNQGQVLANFDSKELCEGQNNTWKDRYKYIHSNNCASIGPNRPIRQPDIPTEWTGGVIKNDGGIHRSDCASSIMSSCNANCESGYGGGGEYICQYNSGGSDVCDTIDKKVIPNKKELCQSQATCTWDKTTNKCSHNSDFTDDGHLEWIGSPCYKIDNTAFSHGISKLPDLDNVFPPFMRVIFHLFIIFIIMIPSIYIFTKYLLKYIGMFTDKSFNATFGVTNKLIDYFTVDNKLFDLIIDRNMSAKEKSFIIGGGISLFLGSYYLFDYVKDNVHDIFESGSETGNELLLKLSNASIKVTRAGERVAQRVNQEVSFPDTPQVDKIDIVFDPDRTDISKDDFTLTMIVQLSVVGLVGLIIILFAIKSDQAEKVRNKMMQKM